jgi:hypothetical protein
MEQYPTDFNDIVDERSVTALPGWGGSFLIPRVGDVVLLFDGDRNTCQGVVDRVEPTGLIHVLPIWDTWRDADTSTGPDLAEELRTIALRAQQVGQVTGLKAQET